ncbi:cation-translocating P-type ATPase [Salegentibacter salarius]|uniref:ATPase P n=1 Tax=Salegentibacter salarius TaxID=435906 RepID=A0A2N0TTP5_9FLAO|nr:cation-transporting P-type ATPase [Salegentibacter salarius]PKD18104.1 ATPase P [Salegentibacter salarius]SLK03587.1 Ca2+-transporting ATPase [Salegentibacter salarius]
MEIFYQKEVAEVTKNFEVDPEKGLSKEEAKKVLQEHGRNKLEEHEGKSVWEIILAQINNPVVYLLVAAAVLAFTMGDFAEGIAITVVLLVNTIIGFWMEYQAQQSMQAIKEIDKVKANVLREGKEEEIDAEEVVPGDILIVTAGDLIAADARVIEATEFKVDEAALTGESVPVDKKPEVIQEEKQVADRKNMVYKGTPVTGGKGKAIVVATGMNTEMGSISALVQDQEASQTPLDKKLNKLTKVLIYVILGLAVAFFAFGYLAGKDVYLLVQTAIAWAIAAIPEGLPIVASIALARGMLRLSKKNVLIKRLSAVETLGETTVIFTDKTGTLTKNELTVKAFSIPGDNYWKVNWKEYQPKLSDAENAEDQDNFQALFKISVLANDASLQEEDNDAKGDPLEIALLNFTKAFNEEKFQEHQKLERKLHDPFDSDAMVMGAVYEVEEGFYMAGKGSADKILERSKKILVHGEEKEFTEEDKKEWLEKNDQLSKDGLRVLGFGYKELKELPQGEAEEDFLYELVFAGLVGFIDPPRKEVENSMDNTKNAGIKVVMVTGDHPGTAQNVAKEVHLASEEDDQENVVHGKDLGEKLNKDAKKLLATKVFSRVTPEQKLKLIEFYQEHGEIVGMTGDGVNDAPALKKADIGIAMGKRGTQVAQEVADVVLKDDAFQSIELAIEQGRIIFENIRKFVVYQLSYHLSEIIIIALMSFTLFVLPILPLQLLFLNLLSDVFPALALGIGRGNPGVMDLPPKDPEEPIITKKNWTQIAVYGLIIATSVSGAYLYAHFVWNSPEDITNNIAFFSLAFSQFLHVFNMRDGTEPFFNNQVTRNKYVWMAVALCFATVIVAYFIPGLADVFNFQDLETRVWVLIAIASLLPSVVIQLIKFIKKDF